MQELRTYVSACSQPCLSDKNLRKENVSRPHTCADPDDYRRSERRTDLLDLLRGVSIPFVDHQNVHASLYKHRDALLSAGLFGAKKTLYNAYIRGNKRDASNCFKDESERPPQGPRLGRLCVLTTAVVSSWRTVYRWFNFCQLLRCWASRLSATTVSFRLSYQLAKRMVAANPPFSFTISPSYQEAMKSALLPPPPPPSPSLHNTTQRLPLPPAGSHPVVRIRSHGSRDPQLAGLWVLRAVGEVSRLEQVGTGGEGAEVSLVVNDGQVTCKKNEEASLKKAGNGVSKISRKEGLGHARWPLQGGGGKRAV